MGRQKQKNIHVELIDENGDPWIDIAVQNLSTHFMLKPHEAIEMVQGLMYCLRQSLCASLDDPEQLENWKLYLQSQENRKR